MEIARKLGAQSTHLLTAENNSIYDSTKSSWNRSRNDLLRDGAHRSVWQTANHSEFGKRAPYAVGDSVRWCERHRRDPGEEQFRRGSRADCRFREARDGKTEGTIPARVQRQDLFGRGTFGADSAK